jgi:hypothetical protein
MGWGYDHRKSRHPWEHDGYYIWPANICLRNVTLLWVFIPFPRVLGWPSFQLRRRNAVNPQRIDQSVKRVPDSCSVLSPEQPLVHCAADSPTNHTGHQKEGCGVVRGLGLGDVKVP